LCGRYKLKTIIQLEVANIQRVAAILAVKFDLIIARSRVICGMIAISTGDLQSAILWECTLWILGGGFWRGATCGECKQDRHEIIE